LFFVFKPQTKTKEKVPPVMTQRKRSVSQTYSTPSESTRKPLKKTKGMVQHELDESLHIHQPSDVTFQSNEMKHHDDEETTMESSKPIGPRSIISLGDLISRQTIREHRMTPNELDQQSVMKSYMRGEPSCTLYVKNLTKQMVETELRQLFGNYCDDPKNSER
jgi:hypothetical protein